MAIFQRMRLFCLQLGSFLLTVELFYLQLTILAFLLTVGASLLTALVFFTYSWSFCSYSGKVLRIRALRDCKQRSLTVSKKAPTVSQKASPFSKPSWENRRKSKTYQIWEGGLGRGSNLVVTCVKAIISNVVIAHFFGKPLCYERLRQKH